jgi:hypothetical protein
MDEAIVQFQVDRPTASLNPSNSRFDRTLPTHFIGFEVYWVAGFKDSNSRMCGKGYR